jgi:hypothetical protein
MTILLIIAIYIIAIAIMTLVLGASLFLVEDIKEGSFQTEGQLTTWGKCAAIVVAMTLASFLPAGQWVALVVFFVGVMALFQKTFLQAFLLLIINGLFSRGVAWVIVRILEGLLASS